VKGNSVLEQFASRFRADLKETEIDPVMAVSFEMGGQDIVQTKDVMDYYERLKELRLFIAILKNGEIYKSSQMLYVRKYDAFIAAELKDDARKAEEAVEALPSVMEKDEAVKALYDAFKSSSMRSRSVLRCEFNSAYRKGPSSCCKKSLTPEDLVECAVRKKYDGIFKLSGHELASFRIFAQKLAVGLDILPTGDDALVNMIEGVTYSCGNGEYILRSLSGLNNKKIVGIRNAMLSWGEPCVRVEAACDRLAGMLEGTVAQSVAVFAGIAERHTGFRVIGGVIFLRDPKEQIAKVRDYILDNVVTIEEEARGNFQDTPDEIFELALSQQSNAILRKNGCFVAKQRIACQDAMMGMELQKAASLYPMSGESLMEHLAIFYPKFASQKGLETPKKTLAAVSCVFEDRLGCSGGRLCRLGVGDDPWDSLTVRLL
jgi:hypothetical protein